MPSSSSTVRFQAGLGGYNGVWDTYLDRAAPATNFGREGVFKVKSHELTRMNALLRFDVSAIPPTQEVYRATLYLFCTTYWSVGQHTAYLQPYRLLRPWRESEATWLEAMTATPWSIPGGEGAGSDYWSTPDDSVPITPACQGTWIAVDVTEIVRHWVRQPAENYGLLLRLVHPEGKSVLATFIASDYTPRPQLKPWLEVVHYTPARERSVSALGPEQPQARGGLLFRRRQPQIDPPPTATVIKGVEFSIILELKRGRQGP